MKSNKVVPLTPRHKLIQGDSMVIMNGKTKLILHPCTSTPEESEQAERELHAVMWEMAEALWEKGEEAS
jgi:hypothetical protein